MHIPGPFWKKLQLLSNFQIKFELMCYMICIGCYGHPMACECVYVFYAYHSNNEKTIAFALGMDTGNG